MTEFETLLRQHYGPLERYVKLHLSGTDEAEDVLQEVCMTAFRKFDTLRDSARFKPWILQIARNRCRDYYRSRRASVLPLEDMNLPCSENPEQETVLSALESLAPREQRLLRGFYLEGLSQMELSHQLGIPLGTVKSRLYTARQHFRMAFPAPTKRVKKMAKLPDIMPNYTITPSAQPPFPVLWHELMGWMIVPKEGETLKWAMYHDPSRQKTMYVDATVVGRAKVHGMDGVKIRCVEHAPVPSEQLGDKRDVERFIVAQLTDTHSRILLEQHQTDGVEEIHTFLDDDEFMESWGFGPENCGNPVSLTPSGRVRRDGSEITVLDERWPMDVVGRYTVTLGETVHDTVLVVDAGCYEAGVLCEHYLDENGRTVLMRRFHRDDWAYHHFGRLWTEALPESETYLVNGTVYVHWYDCLTDRGGAV